MVRVLLLPLVVTLGVSGCSSEPSTDGEGGEGEGDCARGVLFSDAEYVERGLLDRAGKPIGSGELATCDDESEDAQGLTFGQGGEKVEVWSIPDVPTGDAVALEIGDSYSVLLNEDLAEPRRTALVEQLELEG